MAWRTRAPRKTKKTKAGKFEIERGEVVRDHRGKRVRVTKIRRAE